MAGFTLKATRLFYGLPQAGKLANRQLKEHLGPAGYYEVAHTPGLFTHVTRPIQFSLIVDDFDVKYVGKEHADHLIKNPERHYDKISLDWEKNYTAVSRWNGITGTGFLILPCRATWINFAPGTNMRCLANRSTAPTKHHLKSTVRQPRTPYRTMLRQK